MYKFFLKDYKAVQRAEIKMDGITVLAGINGCGKSTISRWLYYLVNATHQFDRFRRSYFIGSLENEAEKMQRVFRSTAKFSNYLPIRRQLRQFLGADDPNWDDLKLVYQSFMRKAAEDLSEYAEENDLRGRIAAFLLGEDASGLTDSRQVIDAYLQECSERYEYGYAEYLDAINSYRRKDLEQLVESEFSYGESLPSSALLYEDNLSLLNEGTFIPPLLLRRAIYIDSPMAVFGNGYDGGKGIWSQFNQFVYSLNPDRSDADCTHLKLLIQSIVGGSFQEEDDEFALEKELHFVSSELGIDININEAATGIKSFAYLFRLIENGWLDKDAMLLIDEPEAHLHPQWIVEFARVLVAIHKELHVKIVLASHNPDMVAAIQAIANKEGVIDNTVFYLAEKEKDTPRYTFVDKGKDIGDIFTSFNIALSRISMYGSEMM